MPASRPTTRSWPIVGAHRVTQESETARGRAARSTAPRRSHAFWAADEHRADPVDVLVDQARTRVADLVPLRNARMLTSPFAFFRGSAAIMAADLAATPTSGIRVQLCGDAHLSNFGGYAAPDRSLVFDLNDFDETLPGPWEWDVKRLAASLVVAGRDRGFTELERQSVVRAAVSSYRLAMRELAAAGDLAVWYSRLTVDEIRSRWGGAGADKSSMRRFDRMVRKAMNKDNALALSRLTRQVDGRTEIVSNPPLVVPVADLVGPDGISFAQSVVTAALSGYRRSLPDDRRALIERFHYVDAARKVVGVGSVGTRAWMVLMRGADGGPLALQLKEASTSVLAPYVGRSRYANQGHRVVSGQRLMQTSSDVFLGWCRLPFPDGVSRDFYVRQLWDWKVSADIQKQSSATMAVYAQVCGWTLARAHARSGDRFAIAGYLGSGEVFDVALVEFAERYADQNEADHRAFARAADAGRIDVEALPGQATRA